MTMQPAEAMTHESTVVDGRIITALIQAEPALLQELYSSGLTKEAVSARAARLGLTTEFIKRCRLTGVRPILRKCLKCDATFVSAHAQNRLCRRCPPR